MKKINYTETAAKIYVFKQISGFAIIFGLFALMVMAMIISKSEPKTSELIWDERTTIGNTDAKNYFIIYSDLVCPYCIAFENAIVENEEEFLDYIEKNDVLVEVRLTDFLYEYGESKAIASRHAAVATYCARDEGKFWDYYNHAVKSVWDDFFSTQGKAAFARLNSGENDYWLKLGKEVGLGADWEKCVEEEKPIAEIETNAAKTAKMARGMPYFKFNSYSPPGFDLSWGWEQVLMYFDEGLKH